MNSTDSEYGVLVRSHNQSKDSFGSVNEWFHKYFDDYQLLGKESVARNRYVNWHQVNRPIIEPVEVNVFCCIQRRQKTLDCTEARCPITFPDHSLCNSNQAGSKTAITVNYHFSPVSSHNQYWMKLVNCSRALECYKSHFVSGFSYEFLVTY
jgi:hypothetical protein